MGHEDQIDGLPLFREETPSPPISPKELTVSKCNLHRAVALNKAWHSRFPEIHWSNIVRNKDYACFVAEADAIAYAVAIWSSPIAGNRMNDSHQILELRRMAIADNAPRNTASWMLSKMKKLIQQSMPHIRKLISYQDTETHLGTIYKASNWSPAAEAAWHP